MTNLPQRSRIDLKFSELTYEVKNEKSKGYKQILKGLTGHFRSGNLNALMGPSGAGKSTLMNILAGYRTSSVSGNILINGKPRNLRTFRKQSCYIMQEDHLLAYLTVQESMDVASALKIEQNISSVEKVHLVEEILETLKLEDTRNTRVSSLSGGEKKRLCIALELVSNPPVIFLDEPTSGLDSQNSLQCIKLLKSLAEGGKTVICTIHQPSARLFEKFDMLYALAEGHCIYRGPVRQVVPFLSSIGLHCPSFHNPADFIVEVASEEQEHIIPKMIAAVSNEFTQDCNKNNKKGDLIKNGDCNGTKSNGSVNGHSNIQIENNSHCIYSPKENIDLPSCHQNLMDRQDDLNSDYPATFWTQFYVLLLRTFRSIIRDKMLTNLRLGSHVVVGCLLAVLYYGIGNDASKALNNISFLFFCLLFLVFTAMMPTILTFPIETKVFVREHLNHWYSLKTYYVAKALADLPFQFIFPFVFIIIIYFLTNQPFEVDRFFFFTVFCILTSQVAQSIGLTIGAGMNIQQAVFFGATVAIPALLFSGFFVSIADIPIFLRWLTYFSYIRYGFSGFLHSIYGNGREVLECTAPFCMFKYPVKIMEQLGVEGSSIWFDFFMLILYCFVVRLLGYFILRWKLKKER